MNLESVNGPDGRAATWFTRAVSDGSSRIRPGGREEAVREAEAAPRDRAVAPQAPATREELERLVEDLKGNLGRLNEKLGFRVHEGTGQIVVQIVDRDNGEVIRESPPQEFLDLAVRMREMVGLFLDEQG
jgi:flagellar protein FlaG